MAGPPTSSFGVYRWVFGGVGVPTGNAICTLGVTVVGSEIEEMLDQAEALWDGLKPNVCDAITLERIELKVGPDATGPTLTRAVGEAGTNENDLSGPQVAYLIRKTPAGVSGRFAGRMYWPGVTEATIDNAGSIAGGSRDAMQSVLDAWVAGSQSLGYGPRIFDASSDPRVVVSLDLQSRVATQRRRLRR